MEKNFNPRQMVLESPMKSKVVSERESAEEEVMHGNTTYFFTTIQRRAINF